MTNTRPHSQHDLHSQLEPLREPLMRFFMRRVPDRSDAEDLTQDTFTRLVASSRGDDVKDPKAFVFRIALNLLRDRGRKAQIRAAARVEELNGPRVSATTLEFVEDLTPEDVLQAQDELTRVLSVLNELKPRTKDIFLLYRLENMKQPAIAELFGVSVSTVEKEVMRAARHLAQRLGVRS